MHKNLFAFTEPGISPAYISVNLVEDGQAVSVTVRSRLKDGEMAAAQAEIKLSLAEYERFRNTLPPIF